MVNRDSENPKQLYGLRANMMEFIFFVVNKECI